MPSLSPQPPHLEFASVRAGYDREQPVFGELSLSLQGAGLVRIAGPNGSGKSTLLELVSGFLAPFDGEVRISGTRASSPEARLLRSVCRTAPALYPSMTARDHPAFAARCRHTELAPALARAERYGLGDWLEVPAAELSTGNQRKLWLLACTSLPTPLVILDEPFNGMDEHGVQTLVGELAEWANERLVILIAHTLPGGLEPRQTVALEREAEITAKCGPSADSAYAE